MFFFVETLLLLLNVEIHYVKDIKNSNVKFVLFLNEVQSQLFTFTCNILKIAVNNNLFSLLNDP